MLEALLALAGGGLSGYSAGREQLFARRAQKREQDRADAALAEQQRQAMERESQGRSGLDLSRDDLDLRRILGMGDQDIRRGGLFLQGRDQRARLLSSLPSILKSTAGAPGNIAVEIARALQGEINDPAYNPAYNIGADGGAFSSTPTLSTILRSPSPETTTPGGRTAAPLSPGGGAPWSNPAPLNMSLPRQATVTVGPAYDDAGNLIDAGRAPETSDTPNPFDRMDPALLKTRVDAAIAANEAIRANEQYGVNQPAWNQKQIGARNKNMSDLAGAGPVFEPKAGTTVLVNPKGRQPARLETRGRSLFAPDTDTRAKQEQTKLFGKQAGYVEAQTANEKAKPELARAEISASLEKARIAAGVDLARIQSALQTAGMQTQANLLGKMMETGSANFRGVATIVNDMEGRAAKIQEEIRALEASAQSGKNSKGEDIDADQARMNALGKRAQLRDLQKSVKEMRSLRDQFIQQGGQQGQQGKKPAGKTEKIGGYDVTYN